MFKNILKLALRNSWRHRVYSTINLVGLAIGVACFTLIMLWVQDELSYDRFHQNADRIVRVAQVDAEDPGQGLCRVGAPWGPALQAAFPEIKDYVRFRFVSRPLVSIGDKQYYESEGLYTDSTFFEVFSYSILQGNHNTPLDDPGAIVLTEKLAKKYFGNEDPIGQVLTLDGHEDRVITAIMQDVPEQSHMHFDFLLPFSSYDKWDLNEWEVGNFHVYLLLQPQVDPVALAGKIHQFAAEREDDNLEGARIILQPLNKIHLHSNLQREFEANGDSTSVALFSIVALFILAIACINFINLTTARSATRAKEIAVRKVVGSQRTDLIWQFLGESVFLSVLAVVLAVGIVQLALPYFRELCGKTLVAGPLNHPGLFLVLLTTGLLAGLVSGAYPAFLLSTFRPITILRGRNPLSANGASGNWLRKGLVVLQFGISIALIVGTLVVYRQLGFISNTRLGYEQEQVLVMRIDGSKVLSSIPTFRAELLKNPNILRVSATSNMMGGGDWGMSFAYQGEHGKEDLNARVFIIDENFVETMRMEIAQGRDFSSKFSQDATASILLNETAAKALPWDDPIGKVMQLPTGEHDESGEWGHYDGKIVGVVKDFHFRSLHEQIKPMIMFGKPEWFSYLCLRVRPESLRQTMTFLEDVWRRFEPARPLDTFFLEERFDEMYKADLRFGQTFTVFAVLAIFIACLGLFGLASFVTEQRTKEIGIRKVLGASAGNIVIQLSRDFTKWVVLANFLAWPIAWLVMQNWLQGFAYRIQLGPDLFLISGLLALLVAFATVCYQSVRASLADPVVSLRYE